MTLVDPVALLENARREGRGVGAFNVIQLEHAEALIFGAEHAGLPVILQISENTVSYHGSLEPIGHATLAAARAAGIPVVVHLDHAETPSLIEEAVRLGFTSVMFDGSRLPYAENCARTLEVVRLCHPVGVAVEAELGEVGGKDGVHVGAHAPGARTDPAQARAFVDATEIDSLAVAVGSSHAMTERTARIDLALVRDLAQTSAVPLVLHGSSGVDDVGLAAVMRAGITKINIATRLNQVMTRVVRDRLAADHVLSDPRAYLGPARDAVATETQYLLELLAGGPIAATASP